MPKSQYPQINVRVDGDFLKRVDAWRRDQPDLPNRPEAIRRLVELSLAGTPSKARSRSKKAPSGDK